MPNKTPENVVEIENYDVNVVFKLKRTWSLQIPYQGQISKIIMKIQWI